MRATQKQLDNIEKHIKVINGELCSVKNDIKWIKRLGYYMAIVLTGILARGLL